MKLYIIKKEKGKKYESSDVYESLFGKSLLYDDKGAPLGCSISHTQNYWAVIDYEGSVGLDIEEKHRNVKQTIIRKLHPLEQRYMSALSYGTSEWTEEFLSIWTAKEAFLKLKRTGLSGRLSEFSVISEDLSYKTDIDGFYVTNLNYKGLVICVISEDADIEIVEASYKGKRSQDCISYATALISIKDYSMFDLKKKLKSKGYNDDEIEETAERLKELGYINDCEYAIRFAGLAAGFGKGNAYIKQKLIQSGIDRDLIPENDPEQEFERAFEVANGMYYSCKSPEDREKLLSKIGRRLANRGFSPSIVYKVLAKLRK